MQGFRASPQNEIGVKLAGEEFCAETWLFVLITSALAVGLWRTSRSAEIGRFSTEFSH